MSRISYTFAALAAVVMLAAGSSGAMAGGKHHRHHGLGVTFHSSNHFHHRHHRPIIRFSYGGGGCGYYHDRWMDTGKYYWKSRFYHCKGWW